MGNEAVWEAESESGSKRGLRFEQSYTIAWGDCDAAGVVFYPRYYALFDANTHAMLRAAGLGHHGIRERYQVLGLPLLDAGASFLAPVTYDDQVVLHSQVVRVGRSSVRVAHAIKKDEEEVVRGHEVRVWARARPHDSRRLEALELPEDVRAVLQGDTAHLGLSSC